MVVVVLAISVKIKHMSNLEYKLNSDNLFKHQARVQYCTFKLYRLPISKDLEEKWYSNGLIWFQVHTFLPLEILQ